MDVVRVRRDALLAGAHQIVQRTLQLLFIRWRFLIENNQINRQPLQAPVFMGPQQLPDDSDVLCLVDPYQDDGQIAGNSVRP